MMKKILLLPALFLLAGLGHSMDINPYVEAKITEGWLHVKARDESSHLSLRDNMYQGGTLEVGTKLNQFRIGLEGYCNDTAHDNYIIHTGLVDMKIPVELKSKGFFLNAYWDIPLNEKWKKVKPYIGAGLGYSWLKVSYTALTTDSRRDHDLSWNIGLGMAYELNDRIDLVLGYRYEDLGKLKYSEGNADFTNHKMSVGLRYTF